MFQKQCLETATRTRMRASVCEWARKKKKKQNILKISAAARFAALPKKKKGEVL